MKLKHCLKCNGLMPDDVPRCARCGFDQEQVGPGQAAQPVKPSNLSLPSITTAPPAGSRLSQLAWRFWWIALAASAAFLVAPPYVLRVFPQARTTLLVALGCIVLIGCVSLVFGVIRTAKQRKLKAALVGLAAAVPQMFFIWFCAQLVLFPPNDALGEVCKNGNCISITEAAERGDPEAQFAVAMAHATGRGRPRSDAAAAEWFGRAAHGGDLRGQAYYGMSLYHGVGISANRGEAVKWLSKAAEAGDKKAQSALGVAYYEGGGVPVNYLESEKWWRQAAMQGAVDAQFNIGALYYEGLGVSKNDDEALKWLASAAEHGHPSAAAKIAELGFSWPEDKAKIDEFLASSTKLVPAREMLNPKRLAWNAEKRAKAEALMAKGVDAFDEGLSALFYAVQAQDLALVKALLDKGADPNGRGTDDSDAPIHSAAYGSLEIAALLIDRGARVDLLSKKRGTPIEIAVSNDNNAVAALLFARGANLNIKPRFGGGTLLHAVAIHSDNREMIELLLKHEANPNARDDQGRTPLHVAASTQEQHVIPVPLGKPPSSTYERKIEIVQALIKGGADPSLRDTSGRTAADYAREVTDAKDGVPLEHRRRFEQIIAALRTGK